MYLAYSLLLVIWGILLIPPFLYKAWRYHKSFPGLAQRRGRLPGTLRFNGRAAIWFHSCSVGETLSLQPLVEFLHQRFPEARFLFSTVTQTGQNIAIQRFAAYGKGNTFYFPIDLAPIVRRVLDWIQPAAIVIVDTEIWPNLLRQAHRRGIPVVLANGRISASSFRYYRWARPALRRIFQHYRVLMMQSEEDAARIFQMGAPAEKILMGGNLKFDRDFIEKELDETLARSLETDLGTMASQVPLIVAGSTHAGEEQILFDVLQSLRETPGLEKTRLLLAPRHPERFQEVAQLAARSGLAIARRTDRLGPDREAPVLLLDTVGELAAVYRFATVVFVGGTLVRHGGHSIMEPALYSKAIVTGPSMENFRHIFDAFRLHQGICTIEAAPEDPELQSRQLLDVFRRLLQNEKERNALGAAAFSILESNRGATRRMGETIAGIFEEVTSGEGKRKGNNDRFQSGN
jgi:3-deoxy-D-manno-octulosonic-acid transferase